MFDLHSTEVRTIPSQERHSGGKHTQILLMLEMRSIRRALRGAGSVAAEGCDGLAGATVSFECPFEAGAAGVASTGASGTTFDGGLLAASGSWADSGVTCGVTGGAIGGSGGDAAKGSPAGEGALGLPVRSVAGVAAGPEGAAGACVTGSNCGRL